MIINWKRQCIKVIPVVAANGIEVDTVTLLPGNNAVDPKVWQQARLNVLNQIGNSIIEVAAQVEEKQEPTGKKIKDKNGKEISEKKLVTIVKGKTLKQLDTKSAEEVVLDTYNLDTLKKWKEKENRDSVRSAILNQIEIVEKDGPEAKKKKEAEEK